MQPDVDHLRQQAERARRWAEGTFDKQDRDTLERIAQDYEQMARIAASETPR
jgi:hypothetical protein